MESAGEGTPAIEVEERVQEHAVLLYHLGAAMDRVVQTMDRWERQGVLPASPPAQPGSPLSAPFPPEPSGIRLSLPQEYDGRAANCQGFLFQLNLYLATVHPAPSDCEWVFALISCLTGRALEWANAVWREEDAALDQFEEFTRKPSSTTRPRVEWRVNASTI